MVGANEFTELKQLLEQAKLEDKALKEALQQEQMRIELESLRLRNTELEAKCSTPLDSKVQMLCNLWAKPAIALWVDEFLKNLAETSRAEKDNNKQRTTRGRCHSLSLGSPVS